MPNEYEGDYQVCRVEVGTRDLALAALPGKRELEKVALVSLVTKMNTRDSAP